MAPELRPVKAMRIAYVINSMEGGGATQPVPAIARVLHAAGAQVRVFALNPRDQRGLPAIVAAGLEPLVREGGNGDHRAALNWLSREIGAWGATHIWTSLSRATILGLLLGPRLDLPVICWQHNAFLKPWNRRLMRLLQSRAALWIGDSRSVTALTAEKLHVPANRLACWPIFAADPAMPQAAPWKEGNPIRIGSLGRLHPVKGYDVLIAALGRLTTNGFMPPVPLEIVIAGEGDDRGRLETLAREIAWTIGFSGYADDPRRFLAGLHLYTQPSRSEGFCIAAHEAMTAGLPVVASAVGEMPWSIRQGETGLTVPSDDVDALAGALRAMLEDPSKLHCMGMAARTDMLERYSQARFAETGAAIMRDIRRASA
jgi:glycosyltransferase involved in cell wall biosynthesis